MYANLSTIHTYLGYVVFIVVLVATLLAFRSGSREAPVSRLTALTMVALDVHVTVGIALYLVGQWWTQVDANLLVAVVHPALAIAALGAGHIGIGRARREHNPRIAAWGMATALVLVTAAIGVASL